ADTPLPITNITVNAGSVTLKWAPPLNRTPDDLRLEESSDLVNWDVVDNIKAPKNIDGTSVSVGADTKKFFRLYAADLAPSCPHPPIDWWGRVDHTIMIDLANDSFEVTRFPKDHCVLCDSLSKTDHLYLRYITKTPDGTPDQMGSLVAEGTPVGVTNLNFTSGYYIGVYPVTVAQYRHVMNTSPSPADDDRPVAMVTYNNLRGQNDPGIAPSSGFLWALSNKVALASAGSVCLAFDLPTEAQWEVACRAGTIGTFNNTNAALPVATGFDASWTNCINEVAWWTGNNNQLPYGANVKPVGLKRANNAGLYDMHGNVLEWCLDRWVGGPVGPTEFTVAYPAEGGGNQPVNFGGSDNRSRRGGYWSYSALALRSANRTHGVPSDPSNYTGFRLCARGPEVLPEP
ncbi:MAG: formylglycine-generating enzyme family protein, partial [Kiritimatiellaeota bacterium]|nr:formylglycine-generating enzyme family protein [Kiritimatiellota bacterium]